MRFLTALVVSMLAITCPIDAATNMQKLSLASSVSASTSTSTSNFRTMGEPQLTMAQLNLYAPRNSVPTDTQYISFITEENDKNVEQKGRENKIMIIAWSHEITSPRDPQSGLATGRRQHQPLQVTIPVGSSTPTIYRMFTTGTTLKSIILEQYAPTTSKQAFQGESTLQATTNLNQAQIASIQRNGNELQLQLTYEKIAWNWVDGGITHQDSWRERD